MADTDPVLIHVSIDYKTTDNTVETGLTVAEWNALTDAERSLIAQEIYEVERQNADQGGVSVETDGAEAI